MGATRTVLCTMAAACALAAHSPAPAAASELKDSGNVALTTNYVVRGISQSESSAAIQGGIDLERNGFYAGAWGSSIDFTDLALPASMELDLYGGWRPNLGPIALNLGFIYYAYPNADEDAGGFGEMDFYELYAKAAVSPVDKFSLQGAVAFSPEFTLETGEAWYVEGSAGYALSPRLTASATVGHQTIEDVTGVFDSLVAPFNPTRKANYTAWNAGATYGAFGLEFDLRWHATDIDDANPIIEELFALKQSVEGTAVLMVRKSF